MSLEVVTEYSPVTNFRPVTWSCSVNPFFYPVSCPVTAFCLIILLSWYNPLSICSPLLFCESCFLSLCTVLWQPSVQSCGPVLLILLPIPVSFPPPCLLSYDNLLSRHVVLFYRFRFLSLSCDNNSSIHVVLFCQSCSLFLSPVLWYLLPRMVFICPAIPYSCLMSCDNLLSSHVVLSTNSVFCLSFCDNCLSSNLVLFWNTVPFLFLLSCDNLLSVHVVFQPIL
jgi:hypothetical protein